MFSEQCLLPGLHGYLIRFAPLAFIPHCQIRPRKVPSLIVSPPRINIFYHYPRRTPYVYRSLAAVSSASPVLETRDFTKDLNGKLRMF